MAQNAVSPPRLDAHRAELERVLGAGLFDPHSNLGRLLRYLCDMHFAARQEEIKEYNVAVDVFGRPEDFDKRRDSIVRVEASRLRKRLEEYYQGEGRDHEIRIEIPAGHYVPQFIPNRPVRDKLRILDGAGRAKRRIVSWAPWILLCAVLAGGAAGGMLLWTRGPRADGTSAPQNPEGATAVPANAQEAVRILCGYRKDKFVDRQGRVWLGDRYYHGGTPQDGQAGFITRTLDATMFQSMRTATNFTYDIPLKPGVYELRLYFAETFFGPALLNEGAEASRTMSVTLNDKPLLDALDVYAEAGGNHIADVRAFKDVSPAADGYLHLGFNAIINVPFVNAIEIEPGVPGRIHPIRIAARAGAYTDHSGTIWEPDNYFLGGRLMGHTQIQVPGPDAEFYQRERFGNFSYAIPVPQGRYAVTLHFAETFFGAQPEFANLGRGSRLFHVFCNGKMLLKDFDIFEAAGGARRPVTRTFHGMEPNAQGKILLEFRPVRNYASVNGIEVVDESRP